MPLRLVQYLLRDGGWIDLHEGVRFRKGKMLFKIEERKEGSDAKSDDEKGCEEEEYGMEMKKTMINLKVKTK